MANVRKYKATIVAIENKIDGVYTLTFDSEKEFKFAPGQFLHLAIDTEYDGSGQWPESRCFSLQSSPNEKNAKITYAVKGEFTIQMEKQLNIGTEVWLKLPYGELFEHKHDKSKTVFIAGGTGVTPFLSLFTDQSFLVYENPKIYLGFRSKEYNIYQSALNKMMEIRENLSTMLQIRYENEVGIIDINEIFEQNGTDANYFISGPPIMIKLFRQKLIEKGVSDINILTDDWE